MKLDAGTSVASGDTTGFGCVTTEQTEHTESCSPQQLVASAFLGSLRDTPIFTRGRGGTRKKRGGRRVATAARARAWLQHELLTA